MMVMGEFYISKSRATSAARLLRNGSHLGPNPILRPRTSHVAHRQTDGHPRMFIEWTLCRFRGSMRVGGD